MDCVILRKVPYRLPGTSRLVWAVIVAENQGLSLLFVTKPNGNGSHEIVVGTENVREQVFEVAKNASQFPICYEELGEVGNKLRALAENLSHESFRKRFFSEDDSWWKD